jgi:hypothetical protein
MPLGITWHSPPAPQCRRIQASLTGSALSLLELAAGRVNRVHRRRELSWALASEGSRRFILSGLALLLSALP